MDFDLLLNADASTASIVHRMLRYNTRCSTNETCFRYCRIGGAGQAIDIREWTP